MRVISFVKCKLITNIFDPIWQVTFRSCETDAVPLTAMHCTTFTFYLEQKTEEVKYTPLEPVSNKSL